MRRLVWHTAPLALVALIVGRSAYCFEATKTRASEAKGYHFSARVGAGINYAANQIDGAKAFNWNRCSDYRIVVEKIFCEKLFTNIVTRDDKGCIKQYSFVGFLPFEKDTIDHSERRLRSFVNEPSKLLTCWKFNDYSFGPFAIIERGDAWRTKKGSHFYREDEGWCLPIVCDFQRREDVNPAFAWPSSRVLFEAFEHQPRSIQCSQRSVGGDFGRVGGDGARVCGAPRSLVSRSQIAELPEKQSALPGSNQHKKQCEPSDRLPAKRVPKGFLGYVLLTAVFGWFATRAVLLAVYGDPSERENHNNKT